MTYRLPADIQRRSDDITERLKARQRELDAEAAAEQAERDRQNAATRASYLKTLEDKKAAKQAERDAEFERQVAPLKRREMLQWLVDHPGQAERDFEQVWPHVRELLKLDDKDAAIEREVAAQRRRY